MLCLGDSSSYSSNNVSDTQPNAQASGSFLSRKENSTHVASLLSYQDNRESNTNGNIPNPNLYETINTWRDSPSNCDMVLSNINLNLSFLQWPFEPEKCILQLGGGRQHNTSALIPIFVDKNVASSSKDVFGVGASSSQLGIFPSQDPNNSLTSQTNQHGIFQGFASPSIISFNQTNEKGVFQVQQQFSTFPINGYSDLKMKLGLVNPMGPFPMLKHSMSSESGPIPQEFFPSSSNVMRGNMNRSEE